MILISLGLIKIKKFSLVEKYLSNVCVWICDRYENSGITSLGTPRIKEIEQLMSEYLTGFECQQEITSFTACALLDLSFIVEDKELFENISNDLKSVEIVLKLFHILNDESLISHDNNNILREMDAKCSTSFCDEYSTIIKYERENNTISLRDDSLYFIIFLLRDRYFPTFIKKIL